jgi:membrane protease YdiL (CAAX protease family)
VPPPLYVAPRQGTFSIGVDEEPVHVLTLAELPLDVATPVSTSPRGKFVGLGDAIDHDGAVRDAILELSPDPKLARWTNPLVRLPLLLAPIAWGLFVVGEIRSTSALSADAHRVIDSPEFKQLELDPDTAAETKARRDRIEKMINGRWAYEIGEGAMSVAGIVVVLAGLRRYRAIPAALGLGAALWFLFQAGNPVRCFLHGAALDWSLAIAGLVAGGCAIFLAPSETTIAADLRARLGLPPRVPQIGGWVRSERYWDVVSTLAAVAAGLVLPFVMLTFNIVNAGNVLRIFFFVGFCTSVFIAGLSWRRETSSVPPRVIGLALAASLGFGMLTAADVGVRASFATVIEAQTCIAPQKTTSLNKMQEAGAKETTNARKDTQSDALAFFIAVIAAPLSEEMLYRGTIQRAARRAFGARKAMMLSALVFGIAHAVAFPAAFYQHIGLGLAFAAAFELAGGGAVGVLASAGTHLLWNLWLALTPVG